MALGHKELAAVTIACPTLTPKIPQQLMGLREGERSFRPEQGKPCNKASLNATGH